MRIRLAALLALLVSHVAVAEAPPSTPKISTPVRGLYWEVHGRNGGKAYLLGSIHMLDDSIYPLPAIIENAFSTSTTLAVEANVNGDPAATAQIQQKLMGAAVYTAQGDSLDKHVSKKTYDAVTKVCPLPMEQVKHFKPWFASMLLEIFAAQKAGLNPDLGLDMYFLRKAGDKKIVELEGIDFQIRMFDTLPADQQEGMLYSTALDYADYTDDIHDMLSAWRRGDAEGLNRLVHKDEQKDPTLKPILKALLTTRNVGMADQIDRLIANGGPVFVVVGAAHFVGPEGVVELLRKKGYAVQQK